VVSSAPECGTITDSVENRVCNNNSQEPGRVTGFGLD